MRAAADKIEELNDFQISQCHKLLGRIAELEKRLAASQRREQAAVEDIEHVLADTDYTEVCYLCANRAKGCAAECKPKWRGPQDGKGTEE